MHAALYIHRVRQCAETVHCTVLDTVLGTVLNRTWGNPVSCLLLVCLVFFIRPHPDRPTLSNHPPPPTTHYTIAHYSILRPPINRPGGPVPAQPPNPFLPSTAHSPSRFSHLFFLFIPSPTLLPLPDRINFPFYLIFFLIPVSTLDSLYSATRYGPKTPRSWQQRPASADSSE